MISVDSIRRFVLLLLFSSMETSIVIRVLDLFQLKLGTVRKFEVHAATRKGAVQQQATGHVI